MIVSKISFGGDIIKSLRLFRSYILVTDFLVDLETGVRFL
jgi:hypothetical protein